MGYPMSPERMTQIICGPDPDLSVDHERWPQIMDQIEAIEGTVAYADWEFPGHHRRHRQSQRRTRGALINAIREQGVEAGMWGLPNMAIHEDLSMATYGLYEFSKGITPDFAIKGIYLSEHIETAKDAARFVANTHGWVRAVKQRSVGEGEQRVKPYLAFQAFIRPGDPFVSMTDDDAWILGRTLRSTGESIVWWFEAGSDDRLIQKQLDEAERIAPAFMAGWNAAGIRRAG